MADLKNSQRISYKATYNQISATPAAVKTTGSLSRAVEKAAFVQSLRIIPAELNALKQQLSRTTRGTGSASAPVTAALKAIGTLIGDTSSSSTLNNAALFAKIDASTLVQIANALIDYRQTIGDAVNKSVANILSAYRGALTVPAPAAKAVTQAKAAKGPTTQSSTTKTGIPIVTTTAPAAAKAVRTTAAAAKATIEAHAFSVHVAMDESQPTPAAFSPVLTADHAAYAPSNAEALSWAEKNQPQLFTGLVSQLQPYMNMTADQSTAVGNSNALLETINASFASTFGAAGLRGSVNGFQSRMTIEPVGNLHLERVEMYPAGVERGELLNSVPLAPGETVNIAHKEWAVTEQEFTDFVQDSFAGYSEEGVADKTDIAMSNDSESKHSTALKVGASLSAKYMAVTLSTNFGYNTATNDSQSVKDSRNHSMSITKKASARTKKDHKTTFKVTSVAGSEDQSVRVISNPSTTNGMRIDYFQLARKWKMDLLRYGLRMTYDIVIPNPGSGIVTLVQQAASLDAQINTPFTFTLPLSAITYNSLASNPMDISNYDQLAAQYGATVPAPPEVRKWVNVHKETTMVNDYNNVHYDSVDFAIDDNYYIYDCVVEWNYQNNSGDTNSVFTMLDGSTILAGAQALIGESGELSMDLVYQYVYNYALNITFICRPKVQYLLDWRLQVWNQLRQAAQDQYNASIQNLKDQQAKLTAQIASFDAVTLRLMEQEEIMKGVLRWLLGPTFYLVPFDLASLFGSDSNDPEVQDVLDPNQLSNAEWQDVMEHGEFIKYIHNAIEWENVLYFTYPYFWDDNKLWDFKKFLYHPDPIHRTFLRSGAARVVLTIRPGFEPSFTSLMESGAFGTLPATHPYVPIAQEIQDFANTNYPGFPPANPEQNARPLLYLEQKRVWREMQFIIQLLNACKVATGSFPSGDPGNQVPVAALGPYLNGPVTINGTNYNGINDYNTQQNTQMLALDPTTPQDALLPTYAAVPVNDIAWNNPYFYKCPGDTGDYDLICYGSDGAPGGTDKAADISANCEASLISTWYEYTPTPAMDIGITMNAPNVVPPEPDPAIA